VTRTGSLLPRCSAHAGDLVTDNQVEIDAYLAFIKENRTASPTPSPPPYAALCPLHYDGALGLPLRESRARAGATWGMHPPWRPDTTPATLPHAPCACQALIADGQISGFAPPPGNKKRSKASASPPLSEGSSPQVASLSGRRRKVPACCCTACSTCHPGPGDAS
jgi:hypothetical protein